MMIDMSYYYKGSINSALVLMKDQENMIQYINGYGEKMTTVHSGDSLGEFLAALAVVC